MIHTRSILLGAVIAVLFEALAPISVLAQTPWDGGGQESYGPSAPKHSFLDRKVKEALEMTSRFVERAKKEQFPAYLCVFTTLAAGIAGLLFGMAGYRLSDPMSSYRLVRRRTLLLAVAMGFSLGIFTAVTQVPDRAYNKISLLLLSAGCGIASAFVGSMVSFLTMRWRSIRSAQKDGRRITDRMRHA